MNPENQIRNAHRELGLMSVLNLRPLLYLCLFALCIGMSMISVPVAEQLIIGPPTKVFATTPQRGGSVAISPLETVLKAI